MDPLPGRTRRSMLVSAGPDLPESHAAAVGLCARCVHARTVPSARATYWLCEMSFTDPRFPKYPRLPVLSCAGFTPKAATPENDAASSSEP